MTEVTDTQTTAAPLPQVVPTETVELDTPITRGKQDIAKITVRKPLAGAFRGTNLVDVMQMDVQALTRVLPRITDPALTEAEIRNMNPADLVQLGSVVSGFLVAKRFKGEDPDYLQA